MKSKEHVLHFFTIDEKFPKMSFFFFLWIYHSVFAETCLSFSLLQSVKLNSFLPHLSNQESCRWNKERVLMMGNKNNKYKILKNASDWW